MTERKDLRIGLFANMLTTFGSSLAFIPLGTYLSNDFGITPAFAILLIFKCLPGLLFYRLYMMLNRKMGVVRLISISQAMAFGLSLLLVFVIASKKTIVALVILSLIFFFSRMLDAFFPSLLRIFSEKGGGTLRKELANWSNAKHFSMLISVAVGGYLESRLSLTTILMIDAFSFLAAALIWARLQFNGTDLKSSYPVADADMRDIQRMALNRFNLSVFFRNIAYGVINPMLPAYILGKMNESAEILGVLYLLIGLFTIAGGYISQRVRLGSGAFVLISIAELFLIEGGFRLTNLALFLGVIGTAMSFMVMIEIALQDIFLRSASVSRSHDASVIFSVTESVGLLLGFVLSLMSKSSLSLIDPIWVILVLLLLSIALNFIPGAKNEAQFS